MDCRGLKTIPFQTQRDVLIIQSFTRFNQGLLIKKIEEGLEIECVTSKLRFNLN